MMDLVDVYHHYKINSSRTPHSGKAPPVTPAMAERQCGCKPARHTYMTCTTTPMPETASRSTAFSIAWEMVSNRSSGSCMTRTKFKSTLRVSTPQRRITASLTTMLHLNSLDVEQCKLKLQIFKLKKKEKVSSLTILQTYLNTNKLNPSTGGFRFNTDHIRLPQRFTHAVHLLRAGAAHNKVLCHHGAANQIQGADEGFKGFRI